MATYNVNTWSEFVTAFKASGGTASDPDIIEILSDLDVNDDAPRSYIAAGGFKTINGNFHTIWNLSPLVEFSNYLIEYGGGGREIVWNRVNFNNMYRTNNNPVFHAASGTPMKFNQCTFVMKGPRIADYAVFTQCAITHTNAMWRTSWSGTTLNQCWMHYEPIFTSGVTNFDLNNVTTSYIEGKIDNIPGYTSCPNFARAIDNSVINIESSINFDHLSNISPSANAKCVYNTTKLTGTVGATDSNIVGVTDSQMKDASYLSSVGFNIIT